MTLENMLRWTAIACLFFLPFIVFIVASSLFFPFITGKNFTFRIVMEIAAGAWLALAMVNPRYRPRASWLLYAFTAFVVIIGLADVLGVNPLKSIWSNYERMEGWISIFHLYLFFLVSTSLFDATLWRRWWQTSLVCSTLIACYGVLQLIGLATINQGGIRLDATLGNATYLSIYMLFHIFFALILLFRAWEREPREKMIPGLIYGSIIVFNFFILFFTATRGAILGLIGGLALSALLYIVMRPNARAIRYVGVGFAVLVLAVGALFAAKDTTFVKKTEPLFRLTTIVSDGPATSRLMNIGMAWQGFKERPLLGWGQENYAPVFDKYYNPKMFAQEPWFDRVHNVIFDWLIAGGILGLLAYLALYGTALWTLWRMPTFEWYERTLLTGLLAGYLFYLLFTFDNLMSYILFMSVLGYIAVRATEKAPTLFPNLRLSNAVLPVVAGCMVLVTWGGAWYVNAEPLKANKLLISALSPHQEGITKNLADFKAALALNTYGSQEIREHLSQTVARFSDPSAQMPEETRREFLQLAADEMQKQIDASPLNARFPIFLGVLLNAFGAYDQAKVALEKARELSPNKQSIRFELAANAFARGDTAGAYALIEDTYILAPEYWEAQRMLAVAALRTGKSERFETLKPELLDTGSLLDPRILSYFASVKRYDEIAKLAALHIERYPNELQPYYTHTAGLYASGSVKAAREALLAMKTKFPGETARIDSLIQEVDKGTLKVE